MESAPGSCLPAHWRCCAQFLLLLQLQAFFGILVARLVQCGCSGTFEGCCQCATALNKWLLNRFLGILVVRLVGVRVRWLYDLLRIH